MSQDESLNCRSSFSTLVTTYVPQRRSVSVGGGPSTLLTGYDGTSNATTITYGTMIAHPIIVVWEAKDLSLFDIDHASRLAARLDVPSPTATQIIGAETARASSTLSLSSPTCSNVDSESDGPSVGVKAGIIVGAIFGGFLIASLVLLSFTRFRRRKKNHKGLSHSHYVVPEFEEVRKDGRHELATVHHHHELATKDAVCHELAT